MNLADRLGGSAAQVVDAYQPGCTRSHEMLFTSHSTPQSGSRAGATAAMNSHSESSNGGNAGS